MQTIYTFLQSHSLIWTSEQILIWLAFVLAVAAVLGVLLWRRVITGGRFFAWLLIAAYMGIIVGGTVLTRPVIGSAVQWDPFIEYKIVIDSYNAAGAVDALTRQYIIEIAINVLMLFPLGLLLPLALGRRVAWCQGLVIGTCISLVIEVLQYVTGIGLFQTADVMHNAVGCLIGCVVGDWLQRKIRIPGSRGDSLSGQR